MMSPMAPGRMRSLAADTYGQREVDGLGRQAHTVIAGLVAEFAGKVDQSRRHGCSDLKTSGQFEFSRENRNRCRGEPELQQNGLRVDDFEGGEWSGIPGELQRDQI